MVAGDPKAISGSQRGQVRASPGPSVADGTRRIPEAGSGSTLAAARKLGRSWLGIEIDAGYHAAATRRLAQP